MREVVISGDYMVLALYVVVLSAVIYTTKELIKDYKGKKRGSNNDKQERLED